MHGRWLIDCSPTPFAGASLALDQNSRAFCSCQLTTARALPPYRALTRTDAPLSCLRALRDSESSEWNLVVLLDCSILGG